MEYKQVIKQAFERGETLTVLTTQKKYGTTELRHYVTQIKREINIQSRWVKLGHLRFKEYYLAKKIDLGGLIK